MAQEEKNWGNTDTPSPRLRDLLPSFSLGAPRASSWPPSKEESRGGICSDRFLTSLRPRRVSIQLHVDHATRGFVQNLQRSPGPVQTSCSSNSWKIRDIVGCKYPYLKVKFTFEPNSYSFEGNWLYQQLEDDLWIETNMNFTNSNQDVQHQTTCMKSNWDKIYVQLDENPVTISKNSHLYK